MRELYDASFRTRVLRFSGGTNVGAGSGRLRGAPKADQKMEETVLDELSKTSGIPSDDEFAQASKHMEERFRNLDKVSENVIRRSTKSSRFMIFVS